MKKFTFILFIILVIVAFTLGISADTNFRYDDSFYRVNDFTNNNLLTDDEITHLDDLCVRIATLYEVDVNFSILSFENPTDTTYSEECDELFKANNFGYSITRDTVMFIIDYSNAKSYVKTYGGANLTYNLSELQKICTKIDSSLSNEQSMFSVMKNGLDNFQSYAKSVKTSTFNDGKPSWYPEDIYSFNRFHNENAPRIVDNANIFTNEQKNEIQKKIDKIISEFGYDIVVYTDISSYGLSRGTFAADFYYFNGYGIGDNYSGSILFICFEQNNRGWFTAGTGDVEYLYARSSVINYIDDNLEPYMKKGASNGNINHDYGEGVLNYLDDIYSLYYIPSWYPENEDEFIRTHISSDSSRIIDNANYFSEEEKALLEEKISYFKEKYSYDVVILTETSTINFISAHRHANSFYYYNGYGYGDNYKGCILSLIINDGEVKDLDACLFDDSLDGTNSFGTNCNRLNTRVDNVVIYSDLSTIQKGISKYFSGVESYLKTGSVPFNFNWFIIIVITIPVGLIVGFSKLKKRKKEMKTIYTKAEANQYLVKDSYKNKKIDDMLISVHVSKVAKSSSSSSGHGGGSHSFSSSGGGSFSGGGRSF